MSAPLKSAPLIGVMNKRTYKYLERINLKIGNRIDVEGNVPETPTLICDIFGIFAKTIREKRFIDRVDASCFALAGEFIPSLYGSFQSEKERVQKLSPILHKLFSSNGFSCIENFPLLKRENETRDDHGAGVLVATSENFIDNNFTSFKLVPEVIFEVKNEIGSISSEPVIQGMAYYTHFVDILNKNDVCKIWPSFVVIYIGRVIMVYGAVTLLRTINGSTIHVLSEQLCTFNFDYNNINMICVELANLFEVLRDCVFQLKKWREKVQKETISVVFPRKLIEDKYFCKETSEVTILPKKLVYQNGDRVWKFTRRYGYSAHQFAADLGIAPKLIKYKVMKSEWIFVCMQRIKGKMLCDVEDLDDNAWKFFQQQLAEFWKQYVHGDLRDLNIIYGKLPGEIEKRYYIIDFDWAGESNEMIYPLINMNLVWHSGALPFQKIEVEHDQFLILVIEKQIKINNNNIIFESDAEI